MSGNGANPPFFNKKNKDWTSNINVSTTALHNTFFLAQKELLTNVLSYKGVIEKKFITVL